MARAGGPTSMEVRARVRSGAGSTRRRNLGRPPRVRRGAELTPIFHALTRGGWRNRQHERQLTVVGPDPMEAFQQDPLGAPIPSQAMGLGPAPTPRRTRAGGAHAKPEARNGGRHHRRFVTAGD